MLRIPFFQHLKPHQLLHKQYTALSGRMVTMGQKYRTSH
ncbi:hypothetical protein SS1G_08472 [Sclerotinia sclerotiorum 1980 UF-70]|uniref:Uncharacterized protein n=1 Tax=Sclerotinia sclerotiorum (strain ATCC 18683 / 1980 / Ss-1) TaxID=665079 RepID=A7ET17_SCLS1|nr:hypothetical protein SS1G_08472 [Sclerotinia sclerotiorum 1980 UF-70]EDN92609.1 hypothetical protein SS1G_08472 [Sclerotinia sclerotiorum 1980 UF-70]